MALDASNEKLVGISLRILDKVGRSLFGRNGNKRNTFVRRLEPDDLWAFNGSATRFFGTVAFSFTPLGLLFLFGRGRRWSK